MVRVGMDGYGSSDGLKMKTGFELWKNKEGRRTERQESTRTTRTRTRTRTRTTTTTTTNKKQQQKTKNNKNKPVVAVATREKRPPLFQKGFDLNQSNIGFRRVRGYGQKEHKG